MQGKDAKLLPIQPEFLVDLFWHPFSYVDLMEVIRHNIHLKYSFLDLKHGLCHIGQILGKSLGLRTQSHLSHGGKEPLGYEPSQTKKNLYFQ